ncbi:hypothetical protein [Solirubrum puertoriconensis]|uniref:Uncharacterized protein n=1 Tax=Solirubrum puertoriconensis TaxID=1751427 RepID=A0A9X0HHK3_SOLP1|nr:hypothetical protein [Solirubrum puertoriconensis]KUG06033.1 hypothetical protein ASU33_01300 [Solirubrum puertoriconensis]
MKRAVISALLLLMPLYWLRAQSSPGRYEQVALNFFVKKILPEYGFGLAFCGEISPRLSQFSYMPSCFAPADFAFRDQLNRTATNAGAGQSVALTWTSPQLKRGCRVRRKQPLLEVFTATALNGVYYVLLYTRGRHGATHYMFEISKEEHVVRWCQKSEVF